MTYSAPVSDILRAMGPMPGTEAEEAHAVLSEAARFAAAVLLPLDRTGDEQGPGFREGRVTMPAGWRQAYRRWVAAGWNGLAAPPAYGGQGLGRALQAGCAEIWSAANLSFGLCPMLTASAVEALAAHGSAALKDAYLPKLVSGAWTGTMNLTEPQAGSDLSTLGTRAERAGDGAYRVTGQKIYISYGEHDLAENIVHLVLARLPDAAPGTRGISLFLVPKLLAASDGTLGIRNGVICTGIERKLGMHAAPTCTMSFEGATASLVGAEGRGLNAMFTMMNRARLAVGLQGVGAAERAAQQAIRYARERRQGRAPGEPTGGASPILRHPDVARMAMTMRALTAAARALCHLAAAALDPAEPAQPVATARAALLTPVAKAFATEAANEVASLNIQVHGGLGYIEDSGAGQIARDVRILPIYEGTNGIQALDLVTRRLDSGAGNALDAEFAAMRAGLERLPASGDAVFGNSRTRLREALAALEEASRFLRGTRDTAEALAGATAYLRLFAITRGGIALFDDVVGTDGAGSSSAIMIARFFAEHVAVAAPGLAAAITDGGGSVDQWPMSLGAGP